MIRRLSLVLACVLAFSALPVFAESGEKLIALTFDDGPHPENTESLIALLDKYRITATFFVIGENIDYFPEAFRALVASGHEIGNHTYSHPKLKDESAEGLAEELVRCEETIVRYGGKKPTLFRPPEGVKNQTVATVSGEKGYRTVYWNLDTLDWTNRPCAAIEKTILQTVRAGSIILCHDYIVGGGHTVEALSRIIPTLLADGYRFVSVSELLAKEDKR